ncbi:MAG TPA: hypothetical protein VFD98_02630, partial [Terracidiphilus sp.]|nr:hypothetical protein [Terracidiphilus sp.]
AMRMTSSTVFSTNLPNSSRVMFVLNLLDDNPISVQVSESWHTRKSRPLWQFPKTPVADSEMMTLRNSWKSDRGSSTTLRCVQDEVLRKGLSHEREPHRRHRPKWTIGVSQGESAATARDESSSRAISASPAFDPLP